ncbi:hypothetical protein QP794_02535 [Paenibacillus sp. UMB7766-LJ446]|uniref:hypothetical protein n=1 Tax=unclassified Paenibacillus TaxID=185978 RepID=UPI002550AACA|nr:MULTISPECIES: hypothetical protein [unclassified Paenibacillus]MDK8188962.1 hypothetical protein [Paenibacillus sp. UMB7766-LJ446]MDN8588732.1 hypothetical protein [Paenibacillus sp. 11B]
MRVKKVLELSVDVSDIFRESPLVIRAMLETLPTLESQVAFLRTIHQDVENLLKGVVTNGEPVRESGGQQKDK